MNREPSADVALKFFEALYPELPGLLCIFELPGRQARYFEDRRAAAEWAVSRAAEQNVYFTVALFREQPSTGRGDESLVAGIPGLWADIDVRGPAHKAQNLPPTIEAAKEILAAIEIKPTVLVHSGHGLQAYWLFKEFWLFESEDERKRAKSLVIRWQAMLRAAAQRRGWTVDPTADLVRVLRVPGTLNRKLADAIKPVRFREDGARCTVDAIEEILGAAPVDAGEPGAPNSARPVSDPAEFEPVLRDCAWLQRCRDAAATLPEPEWYHMLTIVARCRQAEKHAHDLSRPYQGYSAAETKIKLAQALEKSPGPATCDYIETTLGAGELCRRCPERGKITSPIQLGRGNRAPWWPDDPPPPTPMPAAEVKSILDAQIEQAARKRDLAAIYALAPQIALLRPLEYQILRNKLQREFGRELHVREFDLEVRSQRLLQKPAGGPPGMSWKAGLHMKDGLPRAILFNALHALRDSPEWKGVLAYDEFAQRPVARRDPPWGPLEDLEWSDNDDRLTTEWLHSHQIYLSAEVAGQAAQTVALEHPFHPVREYLDALTWDGRPRLGTWLAKYVGAEPGEYVCQVGVRWMISAVARIFRPGCKADCCLILEGEQGIKKSTALGILGGDWFTDELCDMGTKDAALQVQGAWIIEISELDGLTRAEVSAIKSFMSRSVDRFRPPYGKRLIASPRSCVFAGTVNHNLYLRDESGGRRFWPVGCRAEEIDTVALERDRDQLWAEAVHQYRAGEPWWLATRPLAQLAGEEARARYQPDPWDTEIARWISVHEEVTVAQILEECIQKPRHQCMQGDANRIARSLRSAGWQRCRSSELVDGKRVWRYLNPAYIHLDPPSQ